MVKIIFLTFGDCQKEFFDEKRNLGNEVDNVQSFQWSSFDSYKRDHLCQKNYDEIYAREDG